MGTSDVEVEGLGPEAIRALRGSLSRAAFARQLGVTPLTVYRWELPDTAAQARRPRGRMAQALRALALGGTPPASPPRPPLLPEESARLEHCVSLMRRAEWRAAEEALLELQASGVPRTAGGHALAAVARAYLQRWGHEDSRQAFATLLPFLAEADAGVLPEAVELQVHSLAANLYASPDGKLFEPEKAAAHAARAEALFAHGTPEMRCLLRLSEVACAFHEGDAERAARQTGLLEESLQGVTSPTLRLLAEDARGHVALIRGEGSQATRRFREVAQGAARLGYSFLEARNLAFLALRRLEEACEPSEALRLVRRAREAAYGGRMVRGFSFIYAARAEADALLRQGRFAEAEAVLDEGDAVVEALSWTPQPLVPARGRALFLTGRGQELRRLGVRLCAYTGPVQRALTVACGHFLNALADLSEGEPARAAEGFATAHARAQEAGGWPFLRRECLTYELESRALAGQLAEARVVLRRAHSLLERLPSAWCAALLHRREALLLALEGRLREAREKLEAALATFRVAHDVTGDVLTRRDLALLAHAEGDAAASEALAACEAELQRLGITPGSGLSPDRLRAPSSVVPAAGPGGASLGAEALVVPFERLSVRGMSAPLIQRELMGVLEGLFPGRAPRLEEVDSQGHTTLLLGEDSRPADEWVEFGDGCGRRLRMGLAGPLPADSRVLLTALSRLAGFALEVATLRGFAEAPPTVAEPEQDAEVPGFIAASPAMKQLRSELARLSASRATVIINGESGSGKEVVARALHTLSSRASRPYVAFNCAAVPRDLFEGQLFGYRRGAFTGAATDSPGVIRAAHGGTLFLDEVGELPLEVQPKLLRFLENGEVFPLGETRPVQVDVRVVAATHRDLAQLVRDGRFREDLFYRLHVVPLRVPPLRERRDDILALAHHFVQQLTPEGQEPPRLGPDALAVLVTHAWPGNVRELRNVLERSLAFGPLPAVLGAEHLRIDP